MDLLKTLKELQRWCTTSKETFKVLAKIWIKSKILEKVRFHVRSLHKSLYKPQMYKEFWKEPSCLQDTCKEYFATKISIINYAINIMKLDWNQIELHGLFKSGKATHENNCLRAQLHIFTIVGNISKEGHSQMCLQKPSKLFVVKKKCIFVIFSTKLRVLKFWITIYLFWDNFRKI